MVWRGARLATQPVALVAVAWLMGCSDDVSLVAPPDGKSTIVVLAPVVSNATATTPQGAGGPGFHASSSLGSGMATEIAYVSLPSGTIPDGGLATIRNTRTGGTVSGAIAAGGLDPVPIEAGAGDVLALDVLVVGGASASFTLTVPDSRPPIIVRTDPPPRKRDVPLNAALMIVFSEPVDPITVSSIHVLQGGAPVSGTVVLSADGLRARFQPAQSLAPNTDYTLSIPTDVADLTGDALEQAATAEFTTGTTVAVASVTTEQAALITNPQNAAVRAFDMSAALHDDGRFTGFFSIFYPEIGARTSGRVTCFTIVDGTAAWVGGVAEESTNPINIGVEYTWRVADNGQRGGDVADRLSLARFDPDAPPGVAAQYCATTPIRDQLFDLLGGDIVVAGATDAAEPPPLASAGVSQIAYGVDGILILPADGSVGWPLTTARNDGSPAWSPDGRKLAFQSDRTQLGNWDVWLINWDRTGLTRLTSGPETDQDPAWSPDGTKLAFVRNGSIHVMNADGSGVTRVSDAGFDSHPSWSPDGSRIVFASSRSGANAIHVMNADGSGVLQLTRDSAADYSPSWSPDGSKIAFQRNLDGTGAIYVMAPDGTGLARLVHGQTPSWSPDGRRILYELFGMTFVMADGSGMTRFFNGFTPAWSPVGTMPPEPTPFRSVEMVSGNGQTDTVRATLAQPLTVRVVHDDGTPQPGVTIRWNKWGAGAALSANVGTTDAAGIASVLLTLGDTPGQVWVRAALTDGTARSAEVLFTATAVPGS